MIGNDDCDRRPSRLRRAGSDLDSWSNCSGRLGARSARFVQIGHFVHRSSIDAWSGRATKTREKTAAPPESSDRQVAGDDAQRAEHRDPEPALAAGMDQVLAEVVGVGVLLSLHPDTRRAGFEHDGIA